MNKYIIGTILNILLINVYLSGQKIADSAIGQVQKIYIDVKKPGEIVYPCLLYTSPSPRDRTRSRMPSSA